MKPIIFNSDMVRAILDNRKTQTRRPIKNPCDVIQDTDKHDPTYHKFEDEYGDGHDTIEAAPYQIGDVLYVRHNYWKRFEQSKYGVTIWDEHTRCIRWEDGSMIECCDVDLSPQLYAKEKNWKHCPSIHMPKWAARIFLKVTGVRVERLQDISGKDVLKEGVNDGYTNPTMGQRFENGQRMAFKNLWNSIYAAPKACTSKHYEAYPWSVEDFDYGDSKTWKGLPLYIFPNPWIFIYDFERTEAVK